MRTARATTGRALLGACVALASSALVASPAGATSRPRTTSPTTASSAVAVTTTTAPSTLAPAPPAPAAADDCAPGAWPAVVSGRPAAYLAGQDGAYLWLDPDGGWALRVTHARPKERLIFSGSLTTSGRFSYLGQPAGEGGNDILELGAARHTIFFRFVDFGSVDGLDFATSCSRSITLKLVVDGQPASPAMVHLGPGETSPSNNPVKIQRVREATDQDITSSPTSTTVP